MEKFHNIVFINGKQVGIAKYLTIEIAILSRQLYCFRKKLERFGDSWKNHSTGIELRTNYD